MDEGWGGLPSCSTALTCTHVRAHTDTSSGGLLDVSAGSQAAVRPLLLETLPHSPRKKSCYSNTPRAKGP